LKISEKIIKEKYTVEIIGKVKIEGEEKEILLKREDQIFKYYYLNLIGIYTPKIPGPTIIFREDTLENVLSAEIKDNQQKNLISPLEKEELELFLQRIKILDIIDRIQTQERGVKERTEYNRNIKQEEVNNKKEESISKNKTENLQKQQNQPKKNENTIKDINIKQEVNMKTRVTDMKNLQQVLEKNKKMPKLQHGDAPLKMGIVESDDLDKLTNEKGQKEQGHSSRYEAVIITKKGKVHALDLENDTQEGTNPLEKNYQVKQNNTVKKGDVLTRLKVGRGTIGIDKGQYGEVEVYHSPRKTIGGKGIEGNKSLDRQLETSNAKNSLEGTDIETLQLAKEHGAGYRSVEDSYNEAKTHNEEKEECQKKAVKDIDGDLDTKSHSHDINEEYVELSSGEKVTYDQLATRWGFYKEGKPDASFIKEKFKEKRQEDKKTEDVIEELDEEYEDPRQTDTRR